MSVVKLRICINLLNAKKFIPFDGNELCAVKLLFSYFAKVTFACSQIFRHEANFQFPEHRLTSNIIYFASTSCRKLPEVLNLAINASTCSIIVQEVHHGCCHKGIYSCYSPSGKSD